MTVSDDQRSRPTLSRDVIADAAMRLTLDNPTAPLTLARLGAELGADPTAIYRHFRNREELVDHLTEIAFGEATAGIEPHDDWRQALTEVASRLRTALLQRPSLAAEVGTRFTGGANERAGVELIAGIFRRAGFAEADVMVHTRTFGALLLATAVASATVLISEPDSHADDMRIAASLFGGEYDHTMEEYEEETFGLVLRTHLAGLEALLERGSASEPTNT